MSFATSLMLLAAGLASPYSVMGYNVLFDASAPEKSLDVIEQRAPDILCLTEVTPAFSKAFETRLAGVYPYRRFHPQPGTWGLGLTSRFPLSDVRVFRQAPHRMPAIEAVAATPSGNVRIACLHLFPPVAGQKKGQSFVDMLDKNGRLRQQQAQAIVKRYASEATPLLIVGDMNEGSGGAAMKVFAEASLRRACEVAENTCGPTYPGATSIAPALWEVDHILGRKIDFLSAGVIRAGGSDHYPVFATFRIPQS